MNLARGNSLETKTSMSDLGGLLPDSSSETGRAYDSRRPSNVSILSVASMPPSLTPPRSYFRQGASGDDTLEAAIVANHHQDCGCSGPCRLIGRLTSGRVNNDDRITGVYSERELMQWGGEIFEMGREKGRREMGREVCSWREAEREERQKSLSSLESATSPVIAELDPFSDVQEIEASKAEEATAPAPAFPTKIKGDATKAETPPLKPLRQHLKETLFPNKNTKSAKAAMREHHGKQRQEKASRCKSKSRFVPTLRGLEISSSAQPKMKVSRDHVLHIRKKR